MSFRPKPEGRSVVVVAVLVELDLLACADLAQLPVPAALVVPATAGVLEVPPCWRVSGRSCGCPKAGVGQR